MADRRTDGMTGGRFPRLRLPLRRAARAVAAASRRRATAAVLAAATAVSAALCGWLGAQVHQRQQEDDRDQEILAAARQSAVNFTSLDYRHYDRDSANVLSGATGAFRSEFEAQLKQLTKVVAANKSVSQGEVLEAGVVHADDHSARVLVVADSRVTNVSVPQGQARNYRMQLDLTRQGGRWLTSEVEFVG